MAAPAWLGKIFGGLASNATELIDEVVTSKEERMTLRNKMQELLLKSEATIQENVTERWKADMNSDSWLSKNIRPLVLVFLVIATVLLIFIDAGLITFTVQDKWTDLLQLVLITVIGAYFGGRSLEKVKK